MQRLTQKRNVFGSTSSLIVKAISAGVTIATNQLLYNLVSRSIEFELAALCREHDIGIICYSPLLQGLLTDKGVATPLDELASTHPHGAPAYVVKAAAYTPPRNLTIDPEHSPFVQRWDALIVLSLVYTATVTPYEIAFVDEAQIADIALSTRVNGELRQEDRTGRMIFSFRKLLNYISTFTTLQPGDVIVTGTPTGAGARFDPPIFLKPGDVVEIKAEGIGLLRNGVEDEA